MTRILADLPDEDIKWLDHLAAEEDDRQRRIYLDMLKGKYPSLTVTGMSKT